MSDQRDTFRELLTYQDVVTNFLNGERQKLVKSNISLGYLEAIQKEMAENGKDENAQENKVGNDRNQLVTVSERINDFREDIKNIIGVIKRLESLLAIEDNDKLYDILAEGSNAKPTPVNMENLKDDGESYGEVEVKSDDQDGSAPVAA